MFIKSFSSPGCKAVVKLPIGSEYFNEPKAIIFSEFISTSIHLEVCFFDISEISYNNLGKRDGIWKVWNHKGELSAIMIYDSGNRIGNWKSLEKDGQIVQTVNY